MKQGALQVTSEKIAATSTYISGGAAILLGLTAQELAAITAAVVCVLSFIISVAINIYFKRQHYLLAKAVMDRNTLMHLPIREEICEVCPIKKRGDE